MSKFTAVCLADDLKADRSPSDANSLLEEGFHQRFGVKSYLTFYNGVQAVGWARLTLALLSGHSYQQHLTLTMALQLVLVLDIVHILLSVVPPSPVGSLHAITCKVLRRQHIFLATFWFVPEVGDSVTVWYMLVLWGLLDIIRYPFYALSIWKAAPPWLRAARYKSFYIIYPPSFASEMLLFWEMLPHVYEKQVHALPLPFLTPHWYYYGLTIFLLWQLVSFPYNYYELHIQAVAAKRKSKTQ